MLVYKEKLEEVDTFDSFYSTPITKDTNIIIAYVNIHVSHHPLNIDSIPLYLDKSYLVFLNAKIISENGILKAAIPDEKFSNTIVIGGTNVLFDRHIELEICYESAFLQLLPETKKSAKMWIPCPTNNFPVNMDLQEVNSFFSYNSLPKNLKDIMRGN